MKVNILTVIISISMLAITTSNVQCRQSQKQKQSQQVQQKPPNEAAIKPTTQLPEREVQSSYVCFPNNRYMEKEQIPVEIDGKTYYGCCNSQLRDTLLMLCQAKK